MYNEVNKENNAYFEIASPAVAAQSTIGLTQLISAAAEVIDLKARFEEYIRHCKTNDVPLLRPITSLLEKTISTAIDAAEIKIDCERTLQSKDELDRQTVECESMARMLLQTKSFVTQCLEWCAPSYDQSGTNQFFDLRAQKNKTVNYERYESKEVEEIEKQLMNVLGYNAEKTALLLTSSGMAAYSVVENFVLREVLQTNDTILVSPYIYFEASGQLTTLKSFNVVFTQTYNVDEILERAHSLQPRLVFLDPLSNTPEQRLIDLDRLFSELGSRIKERVTVVVDGTMSPGCYKEEWTKRSDNVEIIYYESCSKYLQLGFDNTMAGYVLAPIVWKERIGIIRRNTGAILARDCANTFPKYTAETLWKRMSVIERNAMAVMDYFHNRPSIRHLVDVQYPGHHSHPDNSIGRKYKALGGCVSFKFHSGNDYDKLNRFISELISICKAENVRLVKGVSFGHTTPRISASSAMAGFDKPYIRLFVGALESDSILELCKAMEWTFLHGDYVTAGDAGAAA